MSSPDFPTQELGASHPVVRQRGRQHQRQPEEDRPAAVQGLLASVPGQPQGPWREGEPPAGDAIQWSENCQTSPFVEVSSVSLHLLSQQCFRAVIKWKCNYPLENLTCFVAGINFVLLIFWAVAFHHYLPPVGSGDA